MTPEQLFRENIRLAHWFAFRSKRLAFSFGYHKVDDDDLLQCALLGLHLATVKYDQAGKWRLSTVAYRTMSRATYLYIAQMKSVVSVPLAKVFDHISDDEELREEYRDPDPEILLQKIDDSEEIEWMFEVLSPRERDVLTQRFGMDGEKRTLVEVGKHLGISAGRVGQIEHRSILRVRHAAGIYDDHPKAAPMDREPQRKLNPPAPRPATKADLEMISLYLSAFGLF